ncbi:hypothetical protein J6590_053060 [Homalodisca vitripennis]|nr:hypothetical protein J6590_053060 [Homalodisca vitripennis]
MAQTQDDQELVYPAGTVRHCRRVTRLPKLPISTSYTGFVKGSVMWWWWKRLSRTCLHGKRAAETARANKMIGQQRIGVSCRYRPPLPPGYPPTETTDIDKLYWIRQGFSYVVVVEEAFTDLSSREESSGDCQS